MITLPGIPSNLIANNLTPCQPTHPGEVLADELEARDLTVERLATELGVEPDYLHQFAECQRPVTAELAMLLEAALGIKTSIWLKFQADYDMYMAKSDTSFMSRLAAIRRIAAVL